MAYFRDEGYFDSQPWTNYFHLGVAFMAQPGLQLEKYSCCKRQRILDHYGDMRHHMACQILSLWSHLGPLKMHFIPGEWHNLYHSSEISGFRSMKCSSETLQNLLYFMYKKTHVVLFVFHFVQPGH